MQGWVSPRGKFRMELRDLDLWIADDKGRLWTAVHIGDAIVSRALCVGMREAVREMKHLMVQAAR